MKKIVLALLLIMKLGLSFAEDLAKDDYFYFDIDFFTGWIATPDSLIKFYYESDELKSIRIRGRISVLIKTAGHIFTHQRTLMNIC